MTQVLARATTLLDDRKKVKMTGKIYLRAIVPIGMFNSVSLVCNNLPYLTLSVAFIQMLKVSHPKFSVDYKEIVDMTKGTGSSSRPVRDLYSWISISHPKDLVQRHHYNDRGDNSFI